MSRRWVTIHGDCRAVLSKLSDNTFDSIVCDPPYSLGFMGKTWDTHSDFQGWCTAWALECLRVLKPGGHLLAFGGTRTYHRLTSGIEDAGFEIRDSIIWLYGSGFPKSLNVSKAIDKRPGVAPGQGADRSITSLDLTSAATPNAERWNGWGTALKPGHEPIVVARKPLSGTVAQTVLDHGTGALNINACRVAGNPGDGAWGRLTEAPDRAPFSSGTQERVAQPLAAGRWPANVVLTHAEDCVCVGERVIRGEQRDTGSGRRPAGFADIGTDSGNGVPNAPVYGDAMVETWECAPGCPVAELDAQSGSSVSSGTQVKGRGAFGDDKVYGQGAGLAESAPIGFGDSGGASRFFYCAKTSRKERTVSGKVDNKHPTVKPRKLMRWLVRLVTPPNGIVLDPFTGSGSTGIACLLERKRFVGIDQDIGSLNIAQARISLYERAIANIDARR